MNQGLERRPHGNEFPWVVAYRRGGGPPPLPLPEASCTHIIGDLLWFPFCVSPFFSPKQIATERSRWEFRGAEREGGGRRRGRAEGGPARKVVASRALFMGAAKRRRRRKNSIRPKVNLSGLAFEGTIPPPVTAQAALAGVSEKDHAKATAIYAVGA